MAPNVLKKLKRDPATFDALKVFAVWAQETGIDVTSEKAVPQFADALAASLKNSLARDHRLFGERTQAMFEAVVANLGEVKLVKGEDAGDVFAHEEGLQVPDTRIVLADDRNILVEIKNYHGEVNTSYSIKKTYLDGLARYARLVGGDLRIGIFWSQMHMWTLIAPSVFRSRNEKWLEVSFSDAMLANDMGALGDRIIGCPFPVNIRAYVEKLSSDRLRFREERNRYFVPGREITGPEQGRLLFFLMLWGQWEIGKPTILEEDDNHRVVEFTFRPREGAGNLEESSGRGCLLNDFLSSVLSRYWNYLTSTLDGEFTTILPSREAWSDQLLKATNEGDAVFAIGGLVSSLDKNPIRPRV